MAKASRDTLMETLTSDNLSRVKLMEKESIHGRMARYMTGNGTRGLSKDTVSGKVSKMTLT
jgi:hypothetical protein